MCGLGVNKYGKSLICLQSSGRLNNIDDTGCQGQSTSPHVLPSVAVIWINCTNACTGKKKRPLRQCQVPYRSHTDFCAITDGFVQHWVCSSPFSRSEPVTSPSSSWLRKVTSFRQETRQSYYRNDPVKYNLTWPLSHLSYISRLELIQDLFVNQTIIIFMFFSDQMWGHPTTQDFGIHPRKTSPVLTWSG